MWQSLPIQPDLVEKDHCTLRWEFVLDASVQIVPTKENGRSDNLLEPKLFWPFERDTVLRGVPSVWESRENPCELRDTATNIRVVHLLIVEVGMSEG